jgi:mannose-1-phosphate guanylyltransferase
MAGGSGTRFWPYSTPSLPKQFLDLTGEGTMIQLTVERLRGWVPMENIWVLTNGKFVDTVKEQCPELRHDRIVGEPMARDTSAAVALGAGLIEAVDPKATMAVLPADHMIRDSKGFLSSIETAVGLAEKDHFVTLGIEATYPAEIYGYLKAGDAIEGGYHLDGFVEKPERKVAEGYLSQGGYYWNAGMFVWRVSAIMEALSTHLPEHHAMAKELGTIWGQNDWEDKASATFEPLQKVSIDFGLMEKLSDIAMVPAGFDWNDVGGWAALEELLGRDDNGNTLSGANVVRDSRNNIIITQSTERPSLVVGVEDCVIVNGRAGTLVCHRDEIERIKDKVTEVLGL